MKLPRVSLHPFSFSVLHVALPSSLVVAIAVVSITPLVSVAQSSPTESLPPTESELPDPSESEGPGPLEVEVEEANEGNEPGTVDDNERGSNDPEASDSNAVRTTASDSRFFCQFTGGQHTVMYAPKSRPSEAFPWAIPQALGGGWTPELRCLEISRRLERYRPDGLLELQTAIENTYDTVCVTTQKDPQCRIVFTVPPGQDASATRNSVFANLTTADSGQPTEGVTTFVGSGKDLADDLTDLGLSVLGKRGDLFKAVQSRRRGIDLKPFLDPADGGTGTALTQGVSVTRERGFRLQPDNFR